MITLAACPAWEISGTARRVPLCAWACQAKGPACLPRNATARGGMRRSAPLLPELRAGAASPSAATSYRPQASRCVVGQGGEGYRRP